MSMFTKTTPKGVDVMIQKLQNRLYVQLKTVWNLSDTDWTCYGRVYRNQLHDGYGPEAFLGNGEYKDAYFDDSVKLSSFFGLGEQQRYNGSLLSQVFVVFMVRLDQLKPTITAWRPDEEVRRDVENLVKTGIYGFQLDSVETGVDNVFKEYSGHKKKKGLLSRDMYPWHCFRINMTIAIPISNC